MRVLGLDHGTAYSGWAVLEVNLLPDPEGSGNKVLDRQYVANGVIRALKGQTYPYTIAHMVEGVRDLLSTWNPKYVALEAPKDTRGFKANQVLVETLGSFKLTLMQAKYGFVEIPPSTMKKLVTGYGWSDKEEVARAMAQHLGQKFEDLVSVELYKSGPRAGEVRKLLLDGTDALGLAWSLIPYAQENGGLMYNPKLG